MEEDCNINCQSRYFKQIKEFGRRKDVYKNEDEILSIFTQIKVEEQCFSLLFYMKLLGLLKCKYCKNRIN
jgi:hypothetical protein